MAKALFLEVLLRLQWHVCPPPLPLYPPLWGFRFSLIAFLLFFFFLLFSFSLFRFAFSLFHVSLSLFVSLFFLFFSRCAFRFFAFRVSPFLFISVFIALYLLVLTARPEYVSCWSWGDPHIYTYNHKLYDFFGFGEYKLVRMGRHQTSQERDQIVDLEVQVRQQPCPTAAGVTCNVAVCFLWVQ